MLENEDRNCKCKMNNNSNMMVENEDFPNSDVMSAKIGNDSNNCNCCCKKECKPNIPMYSYEFTNIEKEEETCTEKMETREEMIQKIRSLDFAIVELAEYLDTHNDDEKALCLHREYATKLHDLKDKYQKVYGPLTIKFPCNKWRWIEEPWPWERGNF